MCRYQIDPFYCIIPPYMLNKLQESGNKEISDPAINSSFRSSRFRNDRSFFQKSTIHEKTVLGVIAKTQGPSDMQMTVYDCRHKTDFANAKKLWDSKTRRKVISVAAKNVIRGVKSDYKFSNVLPFNL